MARAIARREPGVSGPAREDEGSRGVFRSRRRLWTIAVALVPLAAALPVPEARAEGDEPYRDLFHRGVELMTDGRLNVACPMLEESFRQKPLPGTLFALADCEDRSGKAAQALAHYEAYLLRFELMTPEQKAQHRQRGRDKHAAARKAALEPTVPQLSIRMTAPAAPGTVIKLDGRPLTAASLGSPIRVDPGLHEIRAQAPGASEKLQIIQIALGESKEVPLSIPSARARADRNLNDAPDKTGAGGARPWVGIVGGGVAAASIAAGIGLTVAAQAKYADADRIRETFNEEQRTYCAKTANMLSRDCVQIKGLNRAGDDLQNMGMVGFVTGGAALAGTVLYYVLSPSKRERREGALVQPVITPSHGGVLVAGHF